MKPRSHFFFIASVIGASFFLAGIFLNDFFRGNLSGDCDTKNFTYINTELRCGDFRPYIKKHGYGALKSQVEKFIQGEIENKKASEIALYFRDLENGPTLGIHEHSNFVSASLLKLPYLLGYLELAADNQELLDTRVVYRIDGQNPVLKQNYPPTEELQEGVPYTIGDLLKRMIVYSDNYSAEVLLEYLKNLIPVSPEEYLREIIYNLGIVSKNGDGDEFITVKSYASIFVQLYNASYLNKEMSEKALRLLGESDFEPGLKHGLPEGIALANKFGERNYVTTGEKQLHDCGIVYFPDNPYLICVMTRGTDFKDLSVIISSISEMVYEEIESRKN